MALTDVAIRNAKPMEKQQKLFDGGGLHLLITPAGGKRWVLKYRFGGKEKSLALGTYPDVPLGEARRRREDAREKLAAGIDPGEVKKAEKRTAPVSCALRLAPLLFQRPGELRMAEWGEFDLDNGTWEIPSRRMKRTKQGKISGSAHIVPLPRQAVAILRELQPLTGNGRLLFPSVRTKERPMSDNTINAALRRLGYDGDTMTGHGFRAMARTILDEVLGIPAEIIEAQLAHAVKDPLGRAYNRTSHLPQRRAMMQEWADYLDRLKAGAKVIPFTDAA
ncbi:hypothetical protein R1479_03972 [Ralstonia mannitolilytica]|uniref:tyrosine-type recombinase/integrase n=1 Tax=Ralstonia mannitolilytica TaxID=105219 RepID=UPI0028F637D6|nr:site-specific integrase [Ralstonia mannitolilytica]CAJ0895681.1 hypothetical protein R1479_03972 [Ralstonia mannitolilytica]